MNTTGPSLATAKRIMADIAREEACVRCGRPKTVAIVTHWKARPGTTHMDATAVTSTCECAKAVQS